MKLYIILIYNINQMANKNSEIVTPDFFNLCRDLCGTHFSRILDGLIDILIHRFPSVEKNSDKFVILKKLLNLIGKSQSQERSLYRPLLYLKQHTAYLRHDSKKIITKDDVKKAIVSIGDLIVFLNLLPTLEEEERVKINDVIRELFFFYNNYYNLAKSEKFNVFYEDFSSIIQDINDTAVDTIAEIPIIVHQIPPKVGTIKWFKENGHRDFLRTKKIVPKGGKLEGKICTISRYNGNNTKVSYKEDDVEYIKLLGNIIEVEWFD